MSKFKALLIIWRWKRAKKLLSKTPCILLDYGVRLKQDIFDEMAKALNAEVKVNMGHGFIEGYFHYKGVRVYNLESNDG